MNVCPVCGSVEFVTNPNQYDVLRFDKGDFQIIRSESCDDDDCIFCRECGAQVQAHDDGIILAERNY